MNAAPLFLADGRRAGVWFCGSCKATWGCDSSAAMCCEPSVCSCGSACASPWLKCEDCRRADTAKLEQDRWLKARKLDGMDYHGWVWSESQDRFFRDIGECLDAWFDEQGDGADVPTMYACKPFKMAFDAAGWIHGRLEAHYDGAEDDMPKGCFAELQSLMDAWCRRNSPTSHTPDFGTAITWERL